MTTITARTPDGKPRAIELGLVTLNERHYVNLVIRDRNGLMKIKAELNLTLEETADLAMSLTQQSIRAEEAPEKRR